MLKLIGNSYSISNSKRSSFVGKNMHRLLEGRVEKPHWAAQIENVKNDLASNLLENLGFETRIQPYTCYGSTQKIRVLARVLYAGPKAAADHHDQPVHDMRSLAKRGFRNFTSQIAPYTEVTIRIGGGVTENADEPIEITARSDRAGLIDQVVEAKLNPGWHQIEISTQGSATVTADALIVDESKQKVGVISDIDDTVMVTLLPRPLLAAWNAFVISQASRRVVPGMPVLYQKLRQEYSEQLPFIYLSTGAWNVSPVLQRFLFKNGYPAGPLLLTDWGPTNTGFFRSGQEHKNRSLERLHQIFPKLQWLLIGDNGQHDPEIYSNFAAKYPQAVKAIVIRELTEDQQDLAHGGSHPLKAVGAAVRSTVGIIPKFWKRNQKNEAATSRVAKTPVQNAEAASAKRSQNAVGTLYLSAPDGFELIKLLREHQLLSEKDS